MSAERIAELEAELTRLRKQGRTKRFPVDGIGGHVQMMRERRGMGVRELATRAGMNAGMISRMEQDPAANPTWQTIMALAKGFEMTAAALVDVFEAQVVVLPPYESTEAGK